MIDLNEEPPASEMQLDEQDAAAAAAASAGGPGGAEPSLGDAASDGKGAEHVDKPAAASSAEQQAAHPDPWLGLADADAGEPGVAEPDGAGLDAPDLGVDGDEEVGCKELRYDLSLVAHCSPR